jgi:hypothetical protein
LALAGRLSGVDSAMALTSRRLPITGLHVIIRAIVPRRLETTHGHPAIRHGHRPSRRSYPAIRHGRPVTRHDDRPSRHSHPAITASARQPSAATRQPPDSARQTANTTCQPRTAVCQPTSERCTKCVTGPKPVSSEGRRVRKRRGSEFANAPAIHPAAIWFWRPGPMLSPAHFRTERSRPDCSSPDPFRLGFFWHALSRRSRRNFPY